MRPGTVAGVGRPPAPEPAATETVRPCWEDLGMTKIDGPVVQAAARQGGLVRRDQLRALGVSNGVLDRLRRQGIVLHLTQDVFVLAGTPVTVTMNDQAALWQAGPTAALSYASAIGRVHVSRRLGPDQVTTLDGVRLTTPARTVVDLAGRCSSVHLEDCLLHLRRRSLIDLTAFAAELSAPDVRRTPGRTCLLGVVADLLEREAGDSYLEDRFFAALLGLACAFRSPRSRSVWTVTTTGSMGSGNPSASSSSSTATSSTGPGSTARRTQPELHASRARATGSSGSPMTT